MIGRMKRRILIKQKLKLRTFLSVFLVAIVVALVLNINLARKWLDAVNHSSITVHGVRRDYELLLPAQQLNGPFPLVIFLQDPSDTRKASRYRFGLDDVAVHNRFAVVYPEPPEKGWNFMPPSRGHDGPKLANDDLDFIEALIKDLVTRRIADESRIYLLGETGGGRLAFLAACTHADKIAAIAAVTSTMPTIVSKNCAPSRPMPVLMMDGTNDISVSWQGMSNPDVSLAFLSVSDSAGFWKKANGCDNAPVKKTFPHVNPEDTTAARLELYPRCNGGAQVAVYAIDGGGHQAPSISGDDLMNVLLGPRNHDLDAADEIWRFLGGFLR